MANLEKHLKKLETMGFKVYSMSEKVGHRVKHTVFVTNSKTKIIYQYQAWDKDKAIVAVVLSLPSEIRERLLHNEKLDW